MALTGRSRLTSASSASRRMRQEEELIRRRNAEHDRAELWNGVENYFKNWEVKTTKANEWTSEEFYQANEQLRANAQVNTEKQTRVLKRRDRLRELLTAESEQLVRELRDHEARKTCDVSQLKSFNLELKRREEETRLKEAEIKMHLQWKANEPVLRDRHRQQHASFVRQAWIEQVQGRHKELDEKEKREKEEAERKRREALEEEHMEKELEEQRKIRAIQLQQELLLQIEELRRKEIQAEDLKTEEAKAVREQAELDAIFLERSMEEKQRKNLEHGCFLTHQYQLKLRRRAREIQQELAADLRLLERLMREEVHEQAQRTKKKEQLLTEMEAMRTALKEQEEQEKERERNLEFIFHEEARRMWYKQESQWNADRAARQLLLNQVLIALQEQVETKLTNNLAEQRRLLAEREALLSDVEQANAELKLEKAAQCRRKTETREEIDRQVEEKKQMMRERLRAEAMETERSVEKERAEEEKLLKELANMDVAGYKPQDQGRRRILW